ncbi:hypothetical protein VE02_02162 [Pseudogymnoascus sp. 03VT05]|nr:hypothetical protein VE02_02162 [Pseudogymnoascus sp. 03VT05]
MVHVLDLKSTKSPPPPAVPDEIKQSMEFLHILQEAYGTAVSAMQFLRAAARSAGLSILEPETKSKSMPPPTDTLPREEELQKLSPVIPASTPSNLLPASPSWGVRDELFGQSCLNDTQDMDFFGDIYMLDFDGAAGLDQTADLGFTDTSFDM